MLSYQHLYHAGSNIDCHKHSVLCLLLQKLKEKETPFCYTDLHSARGLYDVHCPEALKTREFETGIVRLWPLGEWPELLAPYHDLVKKINPDGQLRYYPGSPYLAAALLRAQDRLMLYELHPQEFAALEQNMRHEKRAQCFFADGWKALAESLPPKENRGLVLIDPSYELKEDYTRMAERLAKGLQKWRNGIFVVWYPLLLANGHLRMLEGIKNSGLRKILISEITFRDPANGQGIYGSGMLIVNPPWQIEQQISDVSQWLVAQIGLEQRCEWLVEE